jgi:hypothetical protein
MIDTFDDLYKAITAILPSASFGEDNEGQVVIFTDLTVALGDVLVPMVVRQATESSI